MWEGSTLDLIKFVEGHRPSASGIVYPWYLLRKIYTTTHHV